jgi:hypothetical protein
METNVDYIFEIGTNIPSKKPQPKHGNHVSI